MSCWVYQSGVATHFCVYSPTGMDVEMGFVPGKFLLSLFLECPALTSGTSFCMISPDRRFLYLLWAYSVRTHDGMQRNFFHFQLFASLPPTSAGVVEEVLILEFFEGHRWVVHGKLFSSRVSYPFVVLGSDSDGIFP
jgi:hypothetical protein